MTGVFFATNLQRFYYLDMLHPVCPDFSEDLIVSKAFYYPIKIILHPKIKDGNVATELLTAVFNHHIMRPVSRGRDTLKFGRRILYETMSPTDGASHGSD